MNKQLILLLTALALMLPVCALASQVPGEPMDEDEPQVWEFFNARYGTEYTSAASMDSLRVKDLDFFRVPDGHDVWIHAIAHHAIDKALFGWYEPLLPDGEITKELFFTVKISGDMTTDGTYTTTFTFTPEDKFGFYLEQRDGNTFYSEWKRNRKETDQIVAYTPQ